MYRVHDGTIWIEFRDRRVAENVCPSPPGALFPEVIAHAYAFFRFVY